jgi:hypothetical protein
MMVVVTKEMMLSCEDDEDGNLSSAELNLNAEE